MQERFVVAMVLTALVGCRGSGGVCAPPAGGSTVAKAYCQKEKECCSQIGRAACDDISSAQTMNECTEVVDGFDGLLACEQSDVCQKARAANVALLTCMSQINCSDINTSTLIVDKCQAQAKAACNALKEAGENCYLAGGFSDSDCDAFHATFELRGTTN